MQRLAVMRALDTHTLSPCVRSPRKPLGEESRASMMRAHISKLSLVLAPYRPLSLLGLANIERMVVAASMPVGRDRL